MNGLALRRSLLTRGGTAAGRRGVSNSVNWTSGCREGYSSFVVRLFRKGELSVRKRHTSTGFPSVVKRKNGKKVVIWRWYEKGQDGKSRERWKTLGLASRFKSDAAAQQEAERLGLGMRYGDQGQRRGSRGKNP